MDNYSQIQKSRELLSFLTGKMRPLSVNLFLSQLFYYSYLSFYEYIEFIRGMMGFNVENL